MITVEQVLNSQKTNAETVFGLAAMAFEGVEKLIELNISAAKGAIAEASQLSQALLSAKDPHEVMALHSSLLQPTAEKAAAYSRYVYEIVASTGADVTRVAEAQSAEAQAKFMAIVDTAVKNAPVGSENGLALIKSAMAAATNAIETAQKAGKQAAGAAEANFKAMSSTPVSATKGKRAS